MPSGGELASDWSVGIRAGLIKIDGVAVDVVGESEQLP